jgi:hypothetical protein
LRAAVALAIACLAGAAPALASGPVPTPTPWAASEPIESTATTAPAPDAPEVRLIAPPVPAAAAGEAGLARRASAKRVLKLGPGQVVVKGMAERGAILRATFSQPGSAVPARRVVFHWLRDGKAIRGATGSTYRLRAADVGHRVSVRAIGKRQGFLDREYRARPGARVLARAKGIDQRCLEGSVLCADVGAGKLRWIVDGKVRLVLDARFARPGMINRYGAFAVYSKQADAYSYKYDQPMPFAMCYSGSYCVHYSAEFAEVGYANPPGGSHGCVNLRDLDWTRWLYKRVGIGTKVVVHE